MEIGYIAYCSVVGSYVGVVREGILLIAVIVSTMMHIIKEKQKV